MAFPPTTPPPGYGYPPPPGWGVGNPPGFGTEAPNRKGPTWTTVAVAVVLTAVVSVMGTHVIDGPRTAFALSNGGTEGDGTAGTTSAPVADLKADLKSAAIAEESYAVDNAGNFVSGVVSPGDGPEQPLVQQGLQLVGAVTLTATTFVAGGTAGYCLAAVSTATPATWYLSSVDDTPTTVKPKGC